jgi:hypothetical protein
LSGQLCYYNDLRFGCLGGHILIFFISIVPASACDWVSFCEKYRAT